VESTINHPDLANSHEELVVTEYTVAVGPSYGNNPDMQFECIAYARAEIEP